jgi:signal transduction histidine kinase
MRNLIPILLRLFALLAAIAALVLIAFLVLTVFILLIHNTIPFFGQLDSRLIPIVIFSLLCLSALLLFLYIVIQPLMYLIRWLKQMSRGSLEAPAGKKEFSVKFTSRVLYKELFEHMAALTEILKENEYQRELLDQQRHDWTAGISHDLKTPLSYIRGYASMIATDSYSWSVEELTRFGHLIEQKTVYVEELIQDLHSSLSLDKRVLEPVLESTDLVHLVRDCVIDMANSPDAQAYHFSFTPSAECLMAQLDSPLIRRALHNILVNAVTHNPSGTRIDTYLSYTPAFITIAVQDDGIGMDEQTAQLWFERYYRGTTTNKNPAGTGLGLTLAKQFIEIHRGTIMVQSKPHNGCTITIQLPSTAD